MKNIRAPNIVIVGVITAITIVLWIIFGVYKLVSTPQEVNVPTDVLSPLSPTLNQEALTTLEGRIFFTEGELSGVNLITTPEPEESPSPTPSPTPEEEQEEATQSAEQEEATESGETAQ